MEVGRQRRDATRDAADVDARRRFTTGAGLGLIAATVVFTWVVLGGTGDLFRSETLGGVYDAQARSLLHGHWDMPKEPLSYERFTVDGRYYTYFGPWPALLRMPVVLLSDGFDGRLSRVSMLLAFVVLCAFAGRLAWQARVLVRGRGPVGMRTLLAAGGFVFVAGCGSTALFLGSRVWVYHEAVLWAAALSVAAFSFFVSYLVHGRGRDLGWASAAATMALLTRPSVGAGPVLALGALLVVRAWQASRNRRSARRGDPPGESALVRVLGVGQKLMPGSLWKVGIATAVPIALYVYIGLVKFGSPFGVEYDKQDVLLLRPERRASLAATGNTLFGLDYAPTNLVQYFNPFGVGFRTTFPWVTFADAPHVYRNVVFDNIEPSASVTVTSALLVLLTVLGVIAAVRAAGLGPSSREPQGSQRAPSAAVFRLPLLSAAVVTAGTIAIAAHFERYEGDFVPLIVVGGALGLFWIPALLDGRARWTRRLVAVGVVALGLWSCWATLSLTLIYQREYSAFQPTGLRAGFFGFQADVNEALGLGRPSFERGATLPVVEGRELRRTDAPHGQLFVVGDCDGLYISSGRSWEPIEERPAGPIGERSPTPLCDELTADAGAPRD